MIPGCFYSTRSIKEKMKNYCSFYQSNFVCECEWPLIGKNTYILAQAFRFRWSFAIWTCGRECKVVWRGVAATPEARRLRLQAGPFHRKSLHYSERKSAANLHFDHSCYDSGWRFVYMHRLVGFELVNAVYCSHHLGIIAVKSSSIPMLLDSLVIFPSLLAVYSVGPKVCCRPRKVKILKLFSRKMKAKDLNK